MKLGSGIAFALMGAAVGWLLGLSTSPVIQSALGVLLGAVAAIVAAVSGIRTKDETTTATPTNPWPLATLLTALALTAPLGVIVREKRLLGPAAPSDSSPAPSHTKGESSAGGTGLHGAPGQKDCDHLDTSEDGKQLIQSFRTAENQALRTIGNHITEPMVLDSIRQALCSGEQ
jgi:hypothetical protein